MRKFVFGLALLFGSHFAMAEGLSDGTMELSINAIRSEGLLPLINSEGTALTPSFASAPIRVGYILNDQFTLFGGFYIASKKVEDGDDTTDKSMILTAGARANLSSGLMAEGSWSRVTYTDDNGANESDYKGNHFEVLVGRRFQAANGLFIEPKAGVTFGTVELDDDDADFSYGDGLGTEYVITLGYML